MTPGKYDVAARSDRPTDLEAPGANLRQGWSIIATLLVVGIFIEAVFAGAMLSGVSWARAAHAVTAIVLIFSATAAGLVALLALRRIPHGLKLGLTLLSLAGVVALQAALGKMTTQGDNLLWLHVPLGAALIGVAMLAAAWARRLGAK
jgi:hypothetical protein